MNKSPILLIIFVDTEFFFSLSEGNFSEKRIRKIDSTEPKGRKLTEKLNCAHLTIEWNI